MLLKLDLEDSGKFQRTNLHLVTVVVFLCLSGKMQKDLEV